MTSHHGRPPVDPLLTPVDPVDPKKQFSLDSLFEDALVGSTGSTEVDRGSTEDQHRVLHAAIFVRSSVCSKPDACEPECEESEKARRSCPYLRGHLHGSSADTQTIASIVDWCEKGHWMGSAIPNELLGLVEDGQP